MRKFFGVALVSIGVLLIAAALVLGGYNIWDDHRAQAEVNGVLEKIDEIRPAPQDAPIQGGVHTGSGENKIPDYVLNPDMDMPTAEINGYRYIGTVTIPSLDLELPVMETWSYPQMKISPCRYVGSVYLNNLVICAHNYASHFGRLGNLQIGDSVLFCDMDGNLFRYTVQELETLSGTAVEEMESGGWALTLFTCTVSGRARVTVRCSAA